MPHRALFSDRREAGRELGHRLAHYAGHEDVIVLGLPRGGVPVAYEVARMLRAPLDVFLVRKLGVPGQPELAMGAIASEGVRVLDRALIAQHGIEPEVVEAVAQRERAELEERERIYRGRRAPVDARERTAILVDDGLATDSTMCAAVAALRQHVPRRVVVAVPVAAAEACDELEALADEVVCACMPLFFHAVGQFYGDFSPTTNTDVRCILDRGAGS